MQKIRIDTAHSVCAVGKDAGPGQGTGQTLWAVSMQKIRIDTAHSVCPVPCPGPASLPTALSGVYAVHPDRAGPSETKKELISTRNATSVTQNDIMLMRGKAMSSAPIWIGRK